MRKGQRPEAEAVIKGCLEGYRFLQELTTDEAELATDPYRRQQDLFDKIAKGLS